jgi:hypothetical protein
MNINIYLEDKLAKSLNQCVKKLHKSRNAIIREAVSEWIAHHETKKWPSSIIKFKGIPKIVPFESFRQDLLPPDEDPLK